MKKCPVCGGDMILFQSTTWGEVWNEVWRCPKCKVEVNK